MNIRMSQISPTVGDFRGNHKKIIEEINIALQYRDNNTVDVLLFPELAIVGYPPRDLLYDDNIYINNDKVVQSIFSCLKNSLSDADKNMTVIVGGLHRVRGNSGTFKTYNTAWIIDKYDIRCVHKRLLPSYDVFDETRYFNSGMDEPYIPINIRVKNNITDAEISCDVLICEDAWNHKHSTDLKSGFNMMPGSYGIDPVKQCAGDGPIFILNASPYWKGKIQEATDLICGIAVSTRRAVFYCNQVGGYDDVVFHGGSFVVWPECMLDSFYCEKAFFTRMSLFREESKSFRTKDNKPCWIPDCMHTQLKSEDNLLEWNNSHDISGKEVRINIGNQSRVVSGTEVDLHCSLQSIILGVKDYARKTGFKRAVLGSSGGIDSAVAAFIAREVFGPYNVDAISMPSKFSSDGSISDAEQLAKNLQLNYILKPINSIHSSVRESFLNASRPEFSGSVVDENIQPRARALVLMTHSNDAGSLLLSTGNKSELSVGYCTIYGDMCGGFGTISDLWKTEVYAIAKLINKYYDECIPDSIINKEPSAELKEDQKDTDSLPPYEVLDPILFDMVECSCSFNSLVSKHKNIEYGVVQKVWNLYHRAEFKRQQMCNAPKVSKRSFGSGRRIPITAKITNLT